jgi:hypothetical protein
VFVLRLLQLIFNEPFSSLGLVGDAIPETELGQKIFSEFLSVKDLMIKFI